MNATDASNRREFLLSMAALAATLGLPGKLLASPDTERREPSVEAQRLAPAFVSAIATLAPRDVMALCEMLGLAATESQVELFLDALKKRLTSKHVEASLLRTLIDARQGLPKFGNDMGSWLAAFLGAPVGILSLGEHRASLGARLGVVLLSESAPELGIAAPTPKPSFDSDSLRKLGALRPLDELPAKSLAVLWREISGCSALPRFGQVRLPDSSVVAPPRRLENVEMFTVWRANSSSSGQDMQWDLDKLPGLSTRDNYIRAAMYVVVKLEDGTAQMRAHPIDTLGLLNSTLSLQLLMQAPLFLGLCGDAHTQVLAAGHLFIDSRRSIWGMTSDLGRIYLSHSDEMSDESLSVASGVLGTLGYDLSQASLSPVADLMGSGETTLKCGG